LQYAERHYIGKRRQLDLKLKSARLLDKAERLKASVRARIEHSFSVLKQQFGFTKVRYRGLKENAPQIVTLFALSNLWMARRTLMAAG
jgi:IS5 family transposase